jgi:hypothetical protein
MRRNPADKPRQDSEDSEDVLKIAEDSIFSTLFFCFYILNMHLCF